MFRPLIVSVTIVLVGCGATATSQRSHFPVPAFADAAVERGPEAKEIEIGRLTEWSDPTADDWRLSYRSIPTFNEFERRKAICARDPLDFLDNRDYCLHLGDWKDFDTAR